VPAVLKLRLKAPPLPSVPLLNAPVSDITVWAVVSLLVQVTVVPTETVIVAGEKAMFWMDTALPWVCVGVVVGVVVWYDVPQETAPSSPAMITVHDSVKKTILFITGLPGIAYRN